MVKDELKDRLAAIERDMKDMEKHELEQFGDVVRQNNSRLQFVKSLLETCDGWGENDGNRANKKMKKKPSYMKPTSQSIQGSIRVSRSDYTDLKARISTLERENSMQHDQSSKMANQVDVQLRAVRKAFATLSDLVVRELDSVRDEVGESNRIQLNRINLGHGRMEEFEFLAKSMQKELKATKQLVDSLSSRVEDLESALKGKDQELKDRDEKWVTSQKALVNQMNQLVQFSSQIHKECMEKLHAMKTDFEGRLDKYIEFNDTKHLDLTHQLTQVQKHVEKQYTRVADTMDLHQSSLEQKLRSALVDHDRRHKETSKTIQRLDHELHNVEQKLSTFIENFDMYKTTLQRQQNDQNASLEGLREAFKLIKL